MFNAANIVLASYDFSKRLPGLLGSRSVQSTIAELLRLLMDENTNATIGAETRYGLRSIDPYKTIDCIPCRGAGYSITSYTRASGTDAFLRATYSANASLIAGSSAGF